MYVIPTLRHADADTAGRYPLPVMGPAAWQQRAGAWQLDLPLPDLAPGVILVPSLACAPVGTGPHRWTLTAGGARWPLPPVAAVAPPDPVPAQRERAPTDRSPAPRRDSPVSTHIDCFRVHRRLAAPTLELLLEAPALPQRYLVGVSSRPFTVADPPLPKRRAALDRAPPPRSQMTAPGDIASRICSPTCVSMVLDLWQRPHDWLNLAAQCHDPVTGMFGVWPLALQAAARHGCVGAVEVFADWDAPLAVLDRGVPLVTSVRFAAGELPGAPLDETGGHLVVVHAAGPDEVAVCDPAADDGSVLRTYPADAFSRAWLRHRGAAYILPP